MRLLKLKASNVFSLGEVELDLDKRGLVLVTGYSADEGDANGAGKSSLGNKAILWGLFGSTAGSLRADDVVNRHTSPPHFVEITFEGADGNVYKVKRSRKPASLEFECGTERSTQRNEKDTQELINRALGRNFQIFLYSDFFGQGRGENFLSLAPKYQKEILEDILPIAQLSKWAEVANLRKTGIGSLIRDLERDASFCNGGIDKLNKELIAFRDLSALWEEHRKQRIEQCHKWISDHVGAHRLNLEAKAKLEKTLSELVIPEDVSVQYEELQKRGADISASYHKAVATIKAWETEQARCNRKLNEALPGICDSCGQPMPKVVIDSYRKNQDLFKDKLATAVMTTAKSLEAVEFYKKEHEQIVKLRSELSHTMDTRLKAIETKLQLTKDIEAINVSVKADMLAAWKRELELAQKEENPHLRSITSLHETLDIETNLLEHLKESRQMAMVHRDNHVFWADAFGRDIKIHLLNKVCPFLTDRVSKHLAGIGNSQIKVTFTTTKQLKSGDSKDEFSVDVVSSTGGDGYDSLSGGEQQIVSFAVGLALADLAESQAVGISKILILDEPFVSLDQRNSENLISYLVGTLSKRKETILLISNEDNLKTLVPSNIHVEKANGITTITKY